MAIFRGFKPQAMQKIAGRLGYTGAMANFDTYLEQNPDKKRDIKLIPEMLNLLGCTKDNFKKLIQKMNYKAYEKDNEIYFQYNPRKEKVKKIFKKVKIEDSPFKILKEMNLK